MKLNWGQSITIVIILFMAFILTLVYKMHYRNADLVQDDFYEQEVLFNSKKESIFNYENANLQIHVEQTPEGIELQFPSDFTFDNGVVLFYRADDKSLDRQYPLSVNSNHRQILAYTEFIVGKYEINISWNNQEKSYLYQSEINF